MGHQRTRLGKIIGCCVCALVLLTLLAYPSAADPILDPLRDLLVRTVTRFVSKSLNGTVEIKALRGSLLGSPVLHNVVLRDAQGVVMAQIDEIRLAYNLTTLIQKRLTIRAVDIVRPRLTLVQEPDGTLNLARLLPPSQPDKESKEGAALPFAIVVERLQLHDGQLTLRLPSLAGVQRVEGLQVSLQGQVDAQGLHVTLQQLTAHARPAEVTLHTLRGSFQHQAGTMRVDDLHLVLGNSQVTAAGVLPGSEQPANVELRMQPLDMAEIGRLLHNEALHGLIHLTLEAEGPPEALTVRSQLRTEGGSVEFQSQINTVATPLQYRGDIHISKLNLAALLEQAALQSDLNLHLHVAGEGQALENLRGHVQLEIQPSHVGDMALRPSHIDVEMQPHRFHVERFNVDSSVARLTVTGAIDLTGSSDLQYQLRADLAHLQQLLGTKAIGGNVHLQGQARGELSEVRVNGTLQARHIRYQENRLQALDVTYEGTPLTAHPQMTAQLHAQQAQAGTLPVEQMALQATYDGSQQQVHFATQVRQSSTYHGKANGTLSLTKTGQRLTIADLLVQLADRTWQATAPLEVVLEPGSVHLRQFRLAHANESLALSGAVAGQRLQALRLDATQIDLTYLRRLLHLPDMVGGRAMLHVQLDGTLAEPLLQGELAIQPESPQQLPFAHVQTALAYANKQLRSNLRLQQQNREVITFNVRLPVDLALNNLPFAQRLLDGPVEGDLQLTRPELTALHRWQPTLPDMAGTLHGNLTLRGTYAALALDANLQLQQLSVQGVVEQISAPVHLLAAMATATSVAELTQAVAQDQVLAKIERLQLRIPRLSGQLPGHGTSPQSIQIHNLRVQATGQWSAAGLQAKLDTVGLQAEAFGLPRTELALAASLTPEQIELQRLQVRLPQSELRGRGTLAMASQRLQFHADIPRLQLDELALTLPPELPREVQGTLDLRGSLQAPELTARLQYAGAQISADTATQLQTKPPRYTATLRVEALEAARVLPDLQGRFQALLNLQGSGFAASERQAHLDVQIDSTDFTLAPGLAVHLRTHLDGNAVQLEALRVESAPAELMAQGTLSATQQVDLTYTLTLRDLQPLQDHLKLPLQAVGGLSGELRGTLDALQARATVQLTEVGYADLHGASLQAKLSATNLPATPKASLTAQLTDLQGPSLPATSLRLEANYAQPQGIFSAEVTKGPYEQTRLAGEIVLQDEMWLTLERLRLQRQELIWENAEPIAVRRDAHGTLHLQRLRLRSGDQEISVHGILDPEGAMQADVQMQRLQIQPTVRALAPGTTLPDGQLALALTLRGTLEQPQLHGDLRLTSLQWREHSLGDIHAQLGLADRIARTDVRWQDQEQEILRVRGTVGLEPDGAVALHVQTPKLDLARLMPLSSQVRHSAGQLKLDLQLLGTLQQPQAQGVFELRDGELQLMATGERYKDMQVRLLFTGNRVDIERLHAGSRSGTMQLAGWLTVAGLDLQQLDLSLQAQDFTAMHTPAIETQLSGTVTAQGSMQDMAVVGELNVPRARVRLQGVLGSGPAAVEPWELTVPGVYGPGPEVAKGTGGKALPALTQHPLPFLRAEVSVDIPRNAWIQDSGTAVELGGRMQVQKDLQGPFILDGSIETIRGFASFYGKKFVLQEGGTVTFTGAEEINPILDVTALYEVSDYEVTIHVEGKAKQPKLTFSSIPELEQADIISLLVVGKTTDRLTSSEQSALSKQTRAIAGSLAARQMETLIGENLGLDTIEVELGDTPGTGAVSVGRYVTQDLFVSYGREFKERGEQSGNLVGVEYSLNRRLKLKGTSSDLGETAVDFLWRFEY